MEHNGLVQLSIYTKDKLGHVFVKKSYCKSLSVFVLIHLLICSKNAVINDSDKHV